MGKSLISNYAWPDVCIIVYLTNMYIPFLSTDIPENNPDISGIHSKYLVGDVIQVNCTSAPSWPAASLKWYINGEPVRDPLLS